MFKKLRDKLKSAVSVFSKKTEDIAKEEVIEKQPKVEKKEKPIPVKEEKVKVEPEADERKKPEKVIETFKEIKETESEEKPGFFKRLFKKEEIRPEVEEKKEKTTKPVKEIRPKEQEKAFESLEEVNSEEPKKTIEFLKKKEELKVKEVQEIKPVVKEELKKSFFGKLKKVITTRTISADKFEKLFWGLELILLENNVSVEVIEKIKFDLKEELVDKPLPRAVNEKITETLASSLSTVLDQRFIDLLNFDKKPLIVAFFGINGSGKTTTIAKIAQKFLDKNKTVVLAAGDTFRAAAIHQLEEHANMLGVKMIKHDYGADAAAVAYDAVAFAEKNKVDVVLIDTAGRLHSDTNLMDELHKIVRVAKPDLKIFVGESVTGNDCVEQASKFDEKIGIDGIILTKADVDERGGTAISISYVTKKPILYFGTGQGYKDLTPFSKEVVLESLGLV